MGLTGLAEAARIGTGLGIFGEVTEVPGARGAARWGIIMPLLIGQLPDGLFGIGGARRGFSKLDS